MWIFTTSWVLRHGFLEFMDFGNSWVFGNWPGVRVSRRYTIVKGGYTIVFKGGILHFQEFYFQFNRLFFRPNPTLLLPEPFPKSPTPKPTIFASSRPEIIAEKLNKAFSVVRQFFGSRPGHTWKIYAHVCQSEALIHNIVKKKSRDRRSFTSWNDAWPCGRLASLSWPCGRISS